MFAVGGIKSPVFSFLYAACLTVPPGLLSRCIATPGSARSSLHQELLSAVPPGLPSDVIHSASTIKNQISTLYNLQSNGEVDWLFMMSDF